jgi:hypothetical protein
MIIRKILKDMSQAQKDRVLQKELWNICRFRIVQYFGTWRGSEYSGKIDQQLHMRFYYPPQMLSEKIPESRPVEPIVYQADTKEE